jgi:hypothetical protein
MMEAERTSETSVDNYFTRQYIPEDKSEVYQTYLTTQVLLGKAYRMIGELWIGKDVEGNGLCVI